MRRKESQGTPRHRIPDIRPFPDNCRTAPRRDRNARTTPPRPGFDPCTGDRSRGASEGDSSSTLRMDHNAITAASQVSESDFRLTSRLARFFIVHRPLEEYDRRLQFLAAWRSYASDHEVTRSRRRPNRIACRGHCGAGGQDSGDEVQRRPRDRAGRFLSLLIDQRYRSEGAVWGLQCFVGRLQGLCRRDRCQFPARRRGDHRGDQEDDR